MVYYSDVRKIPIENLQHEIHILGVQPSGILLGFATLIIVFMIFPPVAPLSLIFTGGINRILFQKEQSGLPVTFEKRFLRFIKKYPFLSLLFPSTEGIILSNESYHGNF